jgi:hypothetical protein
LKRGQDFLCQIDLGLLNICIQCESSKKDLCQTLAEHSKALLSF